MVALNTAYAPSKALTRSENRVGDFFCEVADCVGEDGRSTRKRIGEKRGCSYDLASSHCYGPFGELIRATGEKKDDFNYRFSTKYEDAETSLLYYGFRYYDPVTGRWLSRDPMQEEGGLNLYGMVENDPVNRWDLLGMLPDDRFFTIFDLLTRVEQACRRCSPDISDDAAELKEIMTNYVAKRNRALRDLIKDVQKNAGALKQFVDDGILPNTNTGASTAINAIAAANDIIDNGVDGSFESAKAITKQARKLVGVTETITKVGGALSASDGLEFIFSAADIGLNFSGSAVVGTGIGPFFGFYKDAWMASNEAVKELSFGWDIDRNLGGTISSCRERRSAVDSRAQARSFFDLSYSRISRVFD